MTKREMFSQMVKLERERDDALDEARETRNSIARFLDVESVKFTRAAEDDFAAGENRIERRERLTAKASILATMAAYVRRGDDKSVA